MQRYPGLEESLGVVGLFDQLEQWDKQNIRDLRDILVEIWEIEPEDGGISPKELVDMADLPSADIPDDIDTGYPVWACDVNGMCLVGATADEIESLDEIRGNK